MTRPLRIYVHLGYGMDARLHEERYHRGLAVDRVPYGFHHVAEFGHEVFYARDKAKGRLSTLLHRGFRKLLGFDLLHAVYNRRRILEADVIWTMSEVEALAAAAVLAAYRRDTPIIGQVIWLFDQWPRRFRVQKRLLIRLLRRLAAITVHSVEYVERGPALLPGLHPVLLKFGVSLESFEWLERNSRLKSPRRVLSMGSDATRDWETLLQAFGDDSRFDVRIVNRSLRSRYSNVAVISNPTMEDFRALYRWADIVVITMVPNLFSGITVALEAAVAGVPLICSRTGGVPTYFDDSEVLYVPPSDPVALRNAALCLTDQHADELTAAAQARFRREDYSTRGMVRRYLELTQHLLCRNESPHSGK